LKTLIIQLWQTSSEDADRAAAPFLLALTAKAMDMHVEVHALGASVELFVHHHPKRHYPVSPLGRPLSVYIQDAIEAGVEMHVCSTALRDRRLEATDLVAGCHGVLGMVSMLERATDLDRTVLTY
jgi:predicted peroxiredoxin